MNTIQCPECGKKVRASLGICPNCGMVLKKASDPLLGKKIMYVVSIIMIILGIVFGIIRILS